MNVETFCSVRGRGHGGNAIFIACSERNHQNKLNLLPTFKCIKALPTLLRVRGRPERLKVKQKNTFSTDLFLWLIN